MKSKIILALVLSTIAHIQAANLVVNGHFDNPLQESGTIGTHPTIPGWSPRGAATAVYVVGEQPPINSWPMTGQGGTGQFVDIGNNAGTGISQAITVPVGFGVAFLSWYDATSTANGQPSTYIVRLLDSMNAVVKSGSYSTSLASWSERSLVGIGALSAGNYTLEFEPTSGFGQNDTLIDNVRMIPETSAAALLCMGGATALLRRRRTV